MVFCGKPSKGCLSCRQRRIKCDQIRPACSQCLRSAKLCEGYRDSLNLSFRNENEKVVRKVLLTLEPSLSKQRKHQTAARISDKTALQTFQSLVIQHTKPNLQLTQTHYNDQGVHFFFTTYVIALLDSPSPNKRFPPVWVGRWPELPLNELLFNTISSVGFAGLGNVTNDKKYMVLARKKFSLAVNTINYAIKNPSDADLESVFKTMLLLSLFQMVSDPLRSNSWSIHIEGCAALSQIMDMKMSRDIPVRHQLKLCFSMFVDCVAKKRPCSYNVLSWYKTLSASMDPSDAPATLLGQLLIKYTIWNASMSQLVSMDPSDCTKEAAALDDELALWEKELPESWSYKVRSTASDPTIGFTDYMVGYRDTWTARIWNDYRWARISINELIICHSFDHNSIFIGDATQVRRSLQINTEMAKGFCNTISRDINDRNNSVPVRGIKSDAVSGNFVTLHPLSVVAQAIGVSEEIHQFAINKLIGMGSTRGIRQAFDLAEAAIEKRQKWKLLLNDWVQLGAVHDETGC